MLKHLFLIILCLVVSASAGRKSDRNKKNCNNWCKGTVDCQKCSSRSGCGTSYTSIKGKVWGKGFGNGNSYYACTSFDHLSKKNKKSCQNYCDSEVRCEKCSTLNKCGSDYTDIPKKSWGQGMLNGKAWHACRKKSHVNDMWEHRKPITGKEEMIIVTLGGASGESANHSKFYFFCENYFWNKNQTLADPKVYCFSGNAEPVTNSGKLARNIKKLIKDVKSKSGKTPKVVFMGKSMGGCKLQHALAGEKAAKGDRITSSIDLFVGVDMACDLGPHHDDHSAARYFPTNVRNIVNFYQSNSHKRGHGGNANMTGFLMKENKSGTPKVNMAYQVNVTKDSWDPGKMRKIRNTAIAPKAEHMDPESRAIQNQPKLLTIIKSMIKRVQNSDL